MQLQSPGSCLGWPPSHIWWLVLACLWPTGPQLRGIISAPSVLSFFSGLDWACFQDDTREGEEKLQDPWSPRLGTPMTCLLLYQSQKVTALSQIQEVGLDLTPWWEEWQSHCQGYINRDGKINCGHFFVIYCSFQPGNHCFVCLFVGWF